MDVSCSSGVKRKRSFHESPLGSRSSPYFPTSVQALCHETWSHHIQLNHAFLTIDELNPQSLYSREVGDIHIVVQASLVGPGGFVETDVIYTKEPLNSKDRETLTGLTACTHRVRPFYVRSAGRACELFQPEIDVKHCTLLGRRTVGLLDSNSKNSLSVHGNTPENNRWIIPFSSKVLEGYRFYVINRFFNPQETKSFVWLLLMVAMYPKDRCGTTSS
jgi:hypothetical protein